MRKFLLTLIIYFLINNQTLALQEIPPPIWEEFCPPEYYNADFEEYINPYSTGEKILFTILFPVGIALSIDETTKKNRIDNFNNELTYWKQREQSFKNMVQSCQVLSSENQPQCYLQVRQMELWRTAKNQELKMMSHQARMQALSDFNNDMQMLRTNTELNGINSNLNQINTNMMLRGY